MLTETLSSLSPLKVVIASRGVLLLKRALSSQPMGLGSASVGSIQYGCLVSLVAEINCAAEQHQPLHPFLMFLKEGVGVVLLRVFSATTAA